MADGLLGTATSGLAAFQRAIAVAGHNISNANTEGYSRQRIELGTRDASFSGQGYIGNGVRVMGVERLFDQFLMDRLRESTSGAAEADALALLTGRVSNMLGDADTGLGAGLENFFNAVQDVADDPSSIPARQLMLTEAESLVARLHNLDGQLDALNEQVNGTMNNLVNEINGLSEAIAQANRDIIDSTGQGAGQIPNDLLDKRDAMVTRLSELVSVRTVEQDDGAVNVFIGTGQPLVTRFLATPMQLQNNEFDAQRKEIAVIAGGASAVVTQNLTGGRLGAALEFRDQVLDPARNALGRIAISLGSDFNAVHRAGMDLDGNAGGDVFSISAPLTSASVDNTGSASVTAVFDTANLANLSTDDYVLSYDGANWNLARFSDGQNLASGSGPFNIDGLQITVGGGAVAGDSYMIRPTAGAVNAMNVVLGDPRAVAAAASAASPAPGDNTNALAMADLQTALRMEGGNASYQGAYGQLIGQLGSQTRSAQIASEAQAALLGQAQESRENLSGVNLDEEAADLLRYQQAYQAVAQVIAAADATFQTLLSAVAR